MCAKYASVEMESPERPREDSRATWSDERLVEECVRGSEEAWSALIDKYKRLIFSIPIKYGLSHDDSTDIFQNVCLELLSSLAKLREPKALAKWIMQVTSHKCLRHKKYGQRMETSDETDSAMESAIPPEAEGIVREAEEEHNLREAIAGMPQRCRQLVEMLFFEEPARPYKEIAQRLGIATGSIGFIRQRCLDKLRARLSETGFR